MISIIRDIGILKIELRGLIFPIFRFSHICLTKCHNLHFFTFTLFFQVILFFFCRLFFYHFFITFFHLFHSLPGYARSFILYFFICLKKCLKNGPKNGQKSDFEGYCLRCRFGHFFGPSFLVSFKSPFVSRGDMFFIIFSVQKRSSLFAIFLFSTHFFRFYFYFSIFSVYIAVDRMGFLYK